MSRTIQTQLLGRFVKIGWSMDMLNDWFRQQHAETGKSFTEIKRPENLKVLGRDEHARYAGKLGVIRSVYRDGEMVCYTIEVDGSLVELVASNFNLIENAERLRHETTEDWETRLLTRTL